MTNIEPTTADLLRVARALVATPGRWRQDTPRGHNAGKPNCTCAGNAISKACTEAHVPVEMSFGVFAKTVGCATDNFVAICDFIYNWNDAKDRTHAEVMRAFDRAIAIEEVARQIKAARLVRRQLNLVEMETQLSH